MLFIAPVGFTIDGNIKDTILFKKSKNDSLHFPLTQL